MSDAPKTRSEAKARATSTPNKWIPSPEVRVWLYGVLAAAAAVATGYGVLTAQQGGLWVAFGAAVLGVGNLLAARNVPKE